VRGGLVGREAGLVGVGCVVQRDVGLAAGADALNKWSISWGNGWWATSPLSGMTVGISTNPLAPGSFLEKKRFARNVPPSPKRSTLKT